MRAAMKQRPQLKETMVGILENLKRKLTNLNCFMKVKYTNAIPDVIELIDGNVEIEKIFQTKLTKEVKSTKIK